MGHCFLLTGNPRPFRAIFLWRPTYAMRPNWHMGAAKMCVAGLAGGERTADATFRDLLACARFGAIHCLAYQTRTLAAGAGLGLLHPTKPTLFVGRRLLCQVREHNYIANQAASSCQKYCPFFLLWPNLYILVK